MRCRPLSCVAEVSSHDGLACEDGTNTRPSQPPQRATSNQEQRSSSPQTQIPRIQQEHQHKGGTQWKSRTALRTTWRGCSRRGAFPKETMSGFSIPPTAVNYEHTSCANLVFHQNLMNAIWHLDTDLVNPCSLQRVDFVNKLCSETLLSSRLKAFRSFLHQLSAILHIKTWIFLHQISHRSHVSSDVAWLISSNPTLSLTAILNFKLQS